MQSNERGMAMKHSEIIEKLTLEEKASLCSGKDFWHLNAVERLGLSSITVSDGPHGLRKQNKDKKAGDLLGSVPAVCFPTASCTACSWDEELLTEMGEYLGDECRAEKISVLLGPGLNIKRSPLCGRNFEYFSEDPFLAGKMAAAFVRGVQSKGIGTSTKHFAANNQETRRMTIDTVADERTLREIYLAGFETVVKEGSPWTVMNAYNKLNGTYCAENEWLLTHVLREQWGFDGVVVTDWGAENEIDKGIAAGQNLEMPGSAGLGAAKLVEAVRNGTLDEAVLDERVGELVELIKKSQNTLCDCEYSKGEHHAFARRVAENSMVLLKNDGGMLPLKEGQTVAVIGEMAKKPRYQGAGSSQIVTTELESAYDAFLKEGVGIVYAQGYDSNKNVTDVKMLADAVECAKNADAAVVFIGLTDEFESEGFDRDTLDIPQNHVDIVNAVSRANPNTAVVLSGGAPVVMPWLGNVKAVLNAYLGGQASGGAVVNLLTGKVNPSGKLAETYPLSLSDTPSFRRFPGSTRSVEYRESVYVGYRYYDTFKKDVLFPFGFGLSYTKFEYSGLRVSQKNMKDTDTLKVTFKVKNVGDVAGAEIAQVYVSDTESTVFRPEKELKGFKKVFLEPGEEKTVSVTLDKRAFAYFNTEAEAWHVESGEFSVKVGASSRDIRLSSAVNVTSTDEGIVEPDYRESAPVYYTGDPANVPDGDFAAVLGRDIPYLNDRPKTEITINSALEDADGTSAGRMVNNLLKSLFKTMSGGNPAQERMMTSMALQIPIRCFISMSMGVFTPEMADGLCLILNGKGTLKGIAKIVGGIGEAVKHIGDLMASV